VRRGLSVLAETGLTYDLLLKPREIPAALQIVADFPQLRFVIDHIAKPSIRSGETAAWAGLMQGFAAQREHVWCKLSGMAEEADWRTWTPAQLRPYVRKVLDIFGAHRCMFGSNWPVCLLAGEYRRIKSALEENIADLPETERAAVMGGAAVMAYRLPLPA